MVRSKRSSVRCAHHGDAGCRSARRGGQHVQHHRAGRAGVVGAVVLLLCASTLDAVSTPASRMPAGWRPRLDPRRHPWLAHMPGDFQNETKLDRETFSSFYPGYEHPGRVIWRHEDVDRALVADSHEQFKPMLHKLHSGGKIHVLAYGSSITQDQVHSVVTCLLGLRVGMKEGDNREAAGSAEAGCFHSGPVSQLAAAVGAQTMPSWSHLYHEEWEGGACTAQQSNYGMGVGWATQFMQVVNSSFPHPGHALINAGRAATVLADFVNLGCLEQHLPATLDLLVLENVAGWSGGVEVEQLIWRILTHYSTRQPDRPAIVMIVPTWLINQHQEPEVSCMRNFTKCDHECAGRPFNHTLGPPNYFVEREAQLLALAQYYGFTLVSHRNFLFSALLHHVPDRERLGECKWMAALHMDGLHLAPLGKKLFAHYLLHSLHKAEEFMVLHPAAEARMVRTPLPKVELFRKGHALRDTRCPVLVDQRSIADAGDRVAGVQEGSVALVTLAEGWSFTERQEDTTVFKYKPGWLTKTPGAKLRIQVNSAFSNEPVGVLRVFYLTSYERMGMAQLTCTQGCQCEPALLNAHTPVRVSVMSTGVVRVSPAAVCEFQLEVLANTSSAGHKFKVIAVTTSTAVDAQRRKRTRTLLWSP